MTSTLVYELLRGPMAAVSVTVFAAGTLVQLARFWFASRPVRSFQYSRDASIRQALRHERARLGWAFAWARFRQTAWGRMPAMAAATMLFHLGLVVVVFLQVGHNVLLDQSWGVSLPCPGEAVTDGLAMLVLAAGAFFCCRRLFLPRVRALSTPHDFAILALVMLPLLTGVMAYHHLFDYHTVIMLHMATGELVLMAVPFTKLMHAFYFLINRFLLAGEHSFARRGVRAW